MNLGSMKDAVYALSGYPTDDGLVTPTVVVGAINNALALIAGEADWPWMRTSTTFASVAGTAAYAVPIGWVRTTKITDPDGYPLIEGNARELEDDFGLDVGTPRYWTVDLEQIELRPIPDAVLTYTHHYVRTEKELAADTETPYLPATWHRAVVQLALVDVHEAGRNPERAEAALKRYEREWRSRMLDDRRRMRGAVRPRVRDGSAL